MNSLESWIADHPVVDVHEHHLPELVGASEVDLLRIFQQSYAGWTQARPYPLPSESRNEDPMLGQASATSWEALQPYLENSGSSMFVRNLVSGLTELYACDDRKITSTNWHHLDEQIRTHHRNPNWRQEVICKANIRHLITDAYSAPLLDARSALGDNYSSVVRMNAFAFGWHCDSRDHNGNSAHHLLESRQLETDTFEHYLESIATLVETLPQHNQVAIKNALAYDRSLDFLPATRAQAKAAWGMENPSPEAKKHFGDYIVDHFCELCGHHDLPMQMHLGTALIRDSHPLKVASLVERHPKTRFLLMHLAYPWSRDLLGMAFVYRNIWIDLTWSALLSPSHFKLALHEAIDILPDDSRMMFGGDNWHIEETYATIRTFRRLIAEVLSEKVEQGAFDEEHAKRLASRILSQNATAFFKLPLAG